MLVVTVDIKLKNIYQMNFTMIVGKTEKEKAYRIS